MHNPRLRLTLKLYCTVYLTEKLTLRTIVSSTPRTFPWPRCITNNGVDTQMRFGRYWLAGASLAMVEEPRQSEPFRSIFATIQYSAVQYLNRSRRRGTAAVSTNQLRYRKDSIAQV